MKFNQSAFDMILPMPLFNPKMRAANRKNIKSMTRRILKLPKWSTGGWEDFEVDGAVLSNFYPAFQPVVYGVYETPLVISAETGCLAEIKSPYGYPSDLRYMREPIFKSENGYAYYLDDVEKTMLNIKDPDEISVRDLEPVRNLLTGDMIKWRWKIGVLSGVYMPKYAARTFKRYQKLRVERLHEISVSDCRAEGLPESEDKHSFMMLWDLLNAKRGYSWESNPFVWVIGYEADKAIAEAGK